MDEVEADGGGGGCRATKAGTITKSRRIARGSTTSKYGSRHTKDRHSERIAYVRFPPREETNESVLEDKYYANSIG